MNHSLQVVNGFAGFDPTVDADTVVGFLTRHVNLPKRFQDVLPDLGCIATALRRSSVNLMRSEIRVTESATDVNGELIFGLTKTRQARTAAIPRSVQAELERHLDSFTDSDADALVFTSPTGRPLRLQNFRRRTWALAVQSAGLPEGLRIHDMRHTAASVLVNAGVPIKSIQEHLGHSSITVTMDRYAHLYPEARQSVATAIDSLVAAIPSVDNRTESNRSGPNADQTRFG